VLDLMPIAKMPTMTLPLAKVWSSLPPAPLTSDGFYSSEMAIKDLQYIGNTYVREFPGARLFPRVASRPLVSSQPFPAACGLCDLKED